MNTYSSSKMKVVYKPEWQETNVKTDQLKVIKIRRPSDLPKFVHSQTKKFKVAGLAKGFSKAEIGVRRDSNTSGQLSRVGLKRKESNTSQEQAYAMTKSPPVF